MGLKYTNRGLWWRAYGMHCSNPLSLLLKGHFFESVTNRVIKKLKITNIQRGLTQVKRRIFSMTEIRVTLLSQCGSLHYLGEHPQMTSDFRLGRSPGSLKASKYLMSKTRNHLEKSKYIWRHMWLFPSPEKYKMLTWCQNDIA